MRKEKESYGYGTLVMTVFIILLTVLLFFLLNSSLFNVNSIKVIGAQRFSAQDIINVSGITYETNIFHVDEQQAKNNIEATPYLEVEDIKRTFPCGVEIYVRERNPFAQISTVNGYYIIDEKCIALGINQIKDDNIISITGLIIAEPELGKKISADKENKADALEKVLVGLKNYGIYGHISEIDITDEEKVQLVYEGTTVKLGSAYTCDSKLKVLEATVNAVEDKLSDGKVLNMETEGAFFVG